MKEEDVSHRRVRGIKTGSMDGRIEELGRIGGGEVWWVGYFFVVCPEIEECQHAPSLTSPSLHQSIML